MSVRALTMLNSKGDTTIAWDESQDTVMEAIIAKKMAEGVTFFIIEPRMGGLLAPTKTKLTDVVQARKHRALSIPDEDLMKFVDSGAGKLVATPSKSIKKSRISRKPREIAQSESVGVQQLRGG